MRNRTKCASPARNGNKSHKSGTSFEKVSSKEFSELYFSPRVLMENLVIITLQRTVFDGV
jgi:hypothetical protein